MRIFYEPLKNIEFLNNIATKTQFDYFNNIEYLFYMYKNHLDELQKHNVFIVLQPDGHWQFIMPQSLYTAFCYSLVMYHSILILHHSVLINFETGELYEDILERIREYKINFYGWRYKFFISKGDYILAGYIPDIYEYDISKININKIPKQYDNTNSNTIRHKFLNTMEIPMDIGFVKYASKKYTMVTPAHYFTYLANMKKRLSPHIAKVYVSMEHTPTIFADLSVYIIYYEKFYGKSIHYDYHPYMNCIVDELPFIKISV